MTIEKVEVVDLIEVVENGIVQIRTRTDIFENGEKLASRFHRSIVKPGQDYSNENTRVKSICAAVHTPEVIAAYEAMMAANRAEPVNEAV